MPRKAKELSQLAVAKLKASGLHAVGGVVGLSLQVTTPDVRSWILRATLNGKRRWFGLGPFPEVSLSSARDIARRHHELIARGIDPVEHAKSQQQALEDQRRAEAAERERNKTFRECATAYIAMMEPSWKNAKHASQWSNTLATYAFPVIGDLYVKDIERSHVLQIVEPIWLTRTETAKRVRHRIHAVLDWADVKGYRSGENPATWRGRLQRLLPAPSAVQEVEHHPSLPHEHVAEFMAELRQAKGIAARALELLILTGARTSEVTGAIWGEVNWDEGYWKAPKERMKRNRDHRKLLAPDAIKLLKSLNSACVSDELIFPSPRIGGELSDMSLSAVIKRIQAKRVKRGLPVWIDPDVNRPITTHGFRATFKTWAYEKTRYPREMAKMALSHKFATATEEAYWRGDFLEKRRKMMRDWAEYCAQRAGKGAVIALGDRRAA